jgi:hypothetical protein
MSTSSLLMECGAMMLTRRGQRTKVKKKKKKKREILLFITNLRVLNYFVILDGNENNIIYANQ